MDTRMPYVSWDRNKEGRVEPTLRLPATEAANAYLKAQGVTKGVPFKLLGGAHSMIERFLIQRIQWPHES